MCGSRAPRLSAFPAITAEWHPTRNGRRLPGGVKASSGEVAWWRCEQGHEWQARVAARTERAATCPGCLHERLGGRDTSAGASAAAAYAARLERHQARIRSERPITLAFAAGCVVVGLVLLTSGTTFGWGLLVAAAVLALRLFVTPSTITAWNTGAEGERLTARYLGELETEGFVVLHDRHIPGTRSANIDHIVIGPPGLFVVETKNFRGRLEIRRGEVHVAGRRRTQILEEARQEALAVQVALGDELERLNLAVGAAVCVHRARLPLFRSVAGGIPILAGADLVRALRKADPVLEPEEVEWLAAVANRRLRPAAPSPGSSG